MLNILTVSAWQYKSLPSIPAAEYGRSTSFRGDFFIIYREHSCAVSPHFTVTSGRLYRSIPVDTYTGTYTNIHTHTRTHTHARN